jgi:hypothetical protein
MTSLTSVRSLLSLLAPVAGLLAVAAPAHAGVKKIKAELLCGTIDESNAVKAPVMGTGKTGKLTDRVACAMHMSDPNEPAHMGNLKTIRHTVDGATGKRKDVAGTSVTTDFGPGSEQKDFEVFLLSGQAMDDGQIAFMPCEDFDIVGTISDDLGVYYTKTIKVVQGCPKPKPLKADVACRYVTKDDKRLKLKAGERPSAELASVECTVTSSDDRFFGDGVVGEIAADWTAWADDGTSKPAHLAESGSVGPSGDGGRPTIELSMTAFTWPNCQDVDLTVKVSDPGGVLLTKKIHTTVTCGE